MLDGDACHPPANFKLLQNSIEGQIKRAKLVEDEAEVEPCGATSRVAIGCWVNLLDQFQHCLLGLVCLLQSRHAGRLQDVVLGHVGHRGADVSILQAVDCALQVRDLVAHNAGCRVEPVDGSPDGAALCGDSRDGGIDCRQRRLGICCAGQGLVFRFNAVEERALMLVVILVLVPVAVVPSPM